MIRVFVNTSELLFILFLSALAVLLTANAAAAEPADTTDGQPDDAAAKIVLAPYLWLPNVHGDVGLSGVSVPLSLQGTKLARGLKGGGMGYIQVSKGKNFLYLDGLGLVFGEKQFQPFFEQNVVANLEMVQLGFGRHFNFETAVPEPGTTTISPYLGAQELRIAVAVKGPALRESVTENWVDPAAGIIVQGPLAGRINYFIKLDAAGFNTNRDNYRSAIGALTFRLGKRWLFGLGYRAATFRAKPSSAKSINLDLTGAGPIAGLQFSF